MPWTLVSGLLMLTLWLAPVVAQAQSITQLSPLGANYVNTVPVQWSITPTNQNVVSIQQTWASSSGGNIWTLTFASIAPSLSFTMAPWNLGASANIASYSPNPNIPNGTYTVRTRYTRSDSLVLNSAAVSLSISSYTTPPIITQPSANTTYSRFWPINYTLPTASSANANFPVTLSFVSGNTNITMVMASSATLQNFLLDTSNLAGSPNISSVVSPNIIPSSVNALTDGDWNVMVTYSDSNGHPAASTQVLNVTRQTVTPASTINTPVANQNYTAIELNYLLPVAASPNSVLATFMPGGYSFSLPWSTYGTPVDVVIANPNMPTGDYNVIISYQDSFGNPTNLTSVGPMHYDLVTPTATFSLAAGTYVSNAMDISIYLPRPASPNTLQLLMTQTQTGATSIITLDANAQSFSISPNILSSTGVLASTASTLGDGPYVFAVRYADTYGHPASTTTTAGFILDTHTQAPNLSAPLANTTDSVFHVAYTLAEAPLAGSVTLQFVGPTIAEFVMDSAMTRTFDWDPTTPASGIPGYVSGPTTQFTNGTYAVIVSYQDSTGNPASAASVYNVTLAMPSLSMAPASIMELASSGNVYVTLANPTNNAVSVHYATADGTAVAGIDYVATSGNLTWPALSTATLPIPVSAIHNHRRTGNLTANVVLSAAAHALLQTTTVPVTIIDADSASVVLTAPGLPTTVTAGGSNANISVVLSSQTASSVIVSAAASALLALQPNTVTFAPGNWNSTQFISVVPPSTAALSGNTVSLLSWHVSSADAFYDNFPLSPTLVAVNGVPQTSSTPSLPPLAHVFVQSPDGSINLGADQNDVFTISSDTQPTSDVWVQPYAGTLLAFDPPVIQITASNWSTPQSVIVSLSAGTNITAPVSTWIDFNITSADTAFTASSALGALAYLNPASQAPGGNPNSVASPPDDGNSTTVPPVGVGGSGGVAGDGNTTGSTVVGQGSLLVALEDPNAPLFTSLENQKTITVQLSLAPTAPVTVHVQADEALTVTPTTLSFDATQWNVAQSVQVTTAKTNWETTSTSALVSFSVSSTDPHYANLSNTALPVPLSVKFLSGCMQAGAPLAALWAAAAWLHARRRVRRG